MWKWNSSWYPYQNTCGNIIFLQRKLKIKLLVLMEAAESSSKGKLNHFLPLEVLVKNCAPCFYWFDSIHILTLAHMGAPSCKEDPPILLFSAWYSPFIHWWQWFNFSKWTQLSIELPSVQNGSLPPFLKWVSLSLSLSLFHFIVGYDKNFHGLFSNKSLFAHMHTLLTLLGPDQNSLWQ